ncbi:response regulator transcription factor [Thalassovita sp.]|uniref:response regulator transcription factor n=1 Tax=Thalassovita sp. TaxID=1979401 RepID=UPI002B26D0E6|nr:response regulator transcription factor [Thalassovita sp.]
MSDGTRISHSTDTEIGGAPQFLEEQDLRVLILSQAEETTLCVDPHGKIFTNFVTDWETLTRELRQHDYGLLALEVDADGSCFDSEKFSLLRKSNPDLHVALFGASIPVSVARNALRTGITGIFHTDQDDAPMDTPLRLVAEGKVYLESAMASQLIGETEQSDENDQPVISLTNTVALVADDDEYFRMAVVAILEDEFGFTDILEASNLEQAKQQMDGCKRIDLALFDLGMPGMFGASSLQGLRLEHPQVRKMAVVSASRNRNDVLEALASGTYGYVAKSEGISEMKHALTQILKGRVYAPALLQEPPETVNKHVRFSVNGTERVVPDRDPEQVAEASRYVPDPQNEEIDLETIPELSPRQRKVLELLVQGMSNKEIARELDLGIGTVKVHMTALFSKLGVSNRTSAVAVGARLL